MSDTVYGRLRGAWEVEEAVQERLRTCSAAYIAEVVDQVGFDAIPNFRAVVLASQLARWPEDQYPVCAIVSPGTDGDVVKDSDGYYVATYSVGVGAITSAATESATRKLAQLYGAAVRGCLLQKRSLNDTVEVTDWKGESLDDLDVDDRRSIMSSVNLFNIELRNIVTWQKGPTDCEEPGPGVYTAEDVTAEVTSQRDPIGG